MADIELVIKLSKKNYEHIKRLGALWIESKHGLPIVSKALLDGIPLQKGPVNLEICKMREATQEEREGIDQYIESIAEPCNDCVSRRAVLDEISDYNNDLDYTTNELYDRIKRMSPVTPQPKIGHWIECESGTEDKENGFETVIVCSHCDFPATTFYSEDCESRTQIRTKSEEV